MSTNKKTRVAWVKDLLVAFAATTLSIILTFGTSMVVNRVNQKKERMLTAMMVMSSIETFAREIDGIADGMGHADTVSQYLLHLPMDRLDDLPSDVIVGLINDIELPFINHDQSAESIFKSSIDTWKNLGNFQFIDYVGHSFSVINQIEKNWNEWISAHSQEITNAKKEFMSSTSRNMGAYVLKKAEVRVQIDAISGWIEWLRYCSALCRQMNRINMSLIDIPEEEVMAFTDERELEPVQEAAGDVNFSDYFKPPIPVDSMYTIKSVQEIVDAALNVRK